MKINFDYLVNDNTEEDYGMLAAGVAVIFMSFVGVLLFFFSPLAATWFTEQPDVIHMVTTALRIDAFAQPFLAIGLVIAGALQGAGDTKSPMYSSAIGMWLIRVLGVYVLSIQLGMGIAGVWLSIAIDLFIQHRSPEEKHRITLSKDDFHLGDPIAYTV